MCHLLCRYYRIYALFTPLLFASLTSRKSHHAKIKCHAITLPRNSLACTYPAQPGVSVFNDYNSYGSSLTPTSSVQAPHTGAKIRILDFSSLGLT